MSDDPSTQSMQFEYCYRDASNFKSFGRISLVGGLSTSDRQEILDKLEDGELFVAEQIGVPPLYEELYKFSGGLTAHDHCWHEFVAFREGQADTEYCQIWGTAGQLLKRFREVNDWDIWLSPHVLL